MNAPITATKESSLRVRIHPGAPHGPGEIGTDDPARWRVLLRLGDLVYTAELVCDITKHIITHEEVRESFSRYGCWPGSPWKRIAP